MKSRARAPVRSRRAECARCSDGCAPEAAFTPLLDRAPGREVTAHDHALGLQPLQSRHHFAWSNLRQRCRQCRRRHRAHTIETAVQEARQALPVGRFPPRAARADRSPPTVTGPDGAAAPRALRPPGRDQRLPQWIGCHFRYGQVAHPGQRIVQFISASRIRPGFLPDFGDGLGIQPPDIGGRVRIEPAAAHHRLGAPLFQRRISPGRHRGGPTALPAPAARAR